MKFLWDFRINESFSQKQKIGVYFEYYVWAHFKKTKKPVIKYFAGKVPDVYRSFYLCYK